MAIKTLSGFQVSSAAPIDTRILLSKAEILEISKKGSIKSLLMPDTYFAVCSTDDQLYVWDKLNEIDPVTGRFRPAIGKIGDRVDKLEDKVELLDIDVHDITTMTHKEIEDIIEE